MRAPDVVGHVWPARLKDKFQELGLNAKLQFANRKAVGAGMKAAVKCKPPTPKTPEDVEMSLGQRDESEMYQLLPYGVTKCHQYICMHLYTPEVVLIILFNSYINMHIGPQRIDLFLFFFRKKGLHWTPSFGLGGIDAPTGSPQKPVQSGSGNPDRMVDW